MGTILSRTEETLGATRVELPSAAENVDEEAEARKRQHEEDMRKFKADLAAKREARKEAIASLNRKIAELREELDKERTERQKLECLLEEGKGGRAEVEGLERQVKALKDVAAIGGEMLRIRELQVNELKEKIKAIEETGVQYEKEVESMRKLKGLYEERARAMTISHQMEVEREKARVVAAETRLEIAEEKNRELLEANKELQERVSSLHSTVDQNNNEISDLRIQLAGKREELYNVTQQMSIVNNLFSQVLSDPENLDRVTRVLEEHHNLVNHLTEKGNINDVASVLMTVADKDHILTEEEQDIATNLSKVWRLLVELLGHHNKQAPGEPMPESCYKSIDTPTGPKLVISVSQTFLRLKDLILEKNSLVKEVGRLKDLNCHLEKRLISQESRLAEVAAELHKTWGVVNKLKSQHKALHTHEQVLRYELKHKRLMLNELKQQLEDCREMWQMARTKNNQTEKDWRLLRKEFADRKQQISSAESGYEESPGDSQDEEDSHRLSDDESDAQEFPIPGNQDVLRISRMHNISLSNSPDRSNTPDVSEVEFPESEEANTTLDPLAEQLNDTAVEVADIASTTRTGNSVGISISTCSEESPQNVELTEGLSSENCHGEVSPQSDHCEENHLPLQVPIPDEMTVELEPRIQILPWNEPQEDTSVVTADNHNIGTKTDEDKHEFESSHDESNQPSSSTMKEEAEVKATTSQSVLDCASSSSSNDSTNQSTAKQTTAEEILARREARLKRLEEQCKSLFNKMNKTNIRSDIISSKLVELHEHYGEGRSDPSTTQGSPALTSSNTPERSNSPSVPINNSERSSHGAQDEPDATASSSQTDTTSTVLQHPDHSTQED